MIDKTDDFIRKLAEELRGISESADDYAEQVYALAVSAAEVLSSVDDYYHRIPQLSGMLLRKFDDSSNVSAINHIELLEKLHGSGGPLEGYAIKFSYEKPKNPKLMAALFFFEQNDSALLNRNGKIFVNKHVGEMAFANGKAWQALRPQIDLVDSARPGHNILQAIPDFLVNVFGEFTTEKDLLFIQKWGGIERLKEVGADLDVICQEVLKKIHITSLAHVSLPIVHRFLKEANEELLASARISKEESNERHCKVMQGVINVRMAQKSPAHECYHAMLLDLVPHLNKDHAAHLVPRLSKYLTVEEITQRVKNLPELVDKAVFKKTLSRHVDACDRYDLVLALGLGDMLKPSDLQKFKGQKLEGAIGL